MNDAHKENRQRARLRRLERAERREQRNAQLNGEFAMMPGQRARLAELRAKFNPVPVAA